MMAMTEHRETALAFLDASDREFDAGDVLQASEKLWGAFSHAVTAVCKQRGWQYGSHRQLINSARQLVAEDGPSCQTPGDLSTAIAEARLFHINCLHWVPRRTTKSTMGDPWSGPLFSGPSA